MPERIETFADRSEEVMKWLELSVAYVLVVLFAIGVFDVGLSLVTLVSSGRFTDPNEVIAVIDTVLVLLIIVEVYQTAVAFSRDEPGTRIVIAAALIAISRKVISYRPSDYATVSDAFVAASAFTLLLGILVVAYYVVRRMESGKGLPVVGDHGTSQE